MISGLAEFQAAATRRIVDCLINLQGSRRFLLADEVGLGKTRVAAGVIDALSERKSDGLTVVYVCSNAEIAEQNREKLCPSDGQVAVNRLSLLALRSSEIETRRKKGGIQLFSFTPGTSLHVGNATGVAYERRLLLYLLGRVWRKRVNRFNWRNYFRCGTKTETWLEITLFHKQQTEFRSGRNKVSLRMQRELQEEWNKSSVTLLNLETGKSEGNRQKLADVIDGLVDSFAQNASGVAKKNRNIVIGELRRGLSRVALEFLRPDLVILDEFQRFKDILEESRDSKTIVGRLLGQRGRAVLIISATPYKMYTEDTDVEDHHKGFIETVHFLCDGGRRRGADADATVDRLKKNLRAFKDTILGVDELEDAEATLLRLKSDIEKDLLPVMCRTERNHHLDDVQKGVEESFTAAGSADPTVTELRHYFQLKKFLRGLGIDDWNITDFWKSTPAPLAFMDAHYSLIQKLRARRVVVSEELVPSSRTLGALAPEHLKFRHLTCKTLGEVGKGLKYLWIKPSYTYYEDEFYGTHDPSKFLVFSHWKFVPKAVSVLLSREAETRLVRCKRPHESAPLRFREPISFSLFDICYPSPVLADLLNPAQLALEAGRLLTKRELIQRAVRAVRKLIAEYQVRETPTHQFPLWRVMARIEAASSHDRVIRNGIRQTEVGKGRGERDFSDQYRNYRKQYLEWMDDQDTPLEISTNEVHRLALIALYSPAVCLLRSMREVFGNLDKWEDKDWLRVLRVGMNQLRNYFNKWTVQMVIRRHSGSRLSYAAKVLDYCRRAHLGAVLDEYAFLLSNAVPSGQPAKMPRLFLRQLAVVLGIGTGSPSLNVLTRAGHIRSRPAPRPAHYAVAFGDDVTTDASEVGGRTRKTAMREAFNSPFWPFVLATTSVGQEGLDFHLYCRDIVHWNLPSNPVDLEQREGRINRFDGLNIRRNISSEYGLKRLAVVPTNGNVWARVFAGVNNDPSRLRHGLYPHWIYENAKGEASTIRRHLSFYPTSSDNLQYQKLKLALALYRLVFGQPRQQDIVENLLKKHPEMHLDDLRRKLTKFTINLSPLDLK